MRWIWRLGTPIVSIAACCLSVYFAVAFRYGTTIGRSSLSTDQMLASLSVIITALGVLVAVVAIALGSMAVYGYQELRQSTHQKLEDHILQIIDKLRDNGDLDSASSRALLETLVPQRVKIFTERVESPQIETASIQKGEEKDSPREQIAPIYPREGEGDGNS